MRRLVVGLSCLALCFSACSSNKASTGVGSAPRPPSRSTLGHFTANSPVPGDDGGGPETGGLITLPVNGEPGGTGTGGQGGSSKPGGTIPDPSLAPGEDLVQYGAEAQDTWGLGHALIRPRAGMAAGATSDHKLIVAEGDTHPSFEVWDPTLGAWSLNASYDEAVNPDTGVPNVLEKGWFFAAYGVHDDQLWTAGGFDSDETAHGNSGRTEMYIYNASGFYQRPPTGARTGAYFLQNAVREPAGAFVDDHTLVVAGGIYTDQGPVNYTQVLDTSTPKNDVVPDAAAPLKTAVAGAAAAAYKGKLYVVGGYIDANNPPTPTGLVQVYDPVAHTWTTGGKGYPPALPVAVHSAGAAVRGNTLWVAGGFDAKGQPTNSVYAIDLTNPVSWSLKAFLPTARGALSLVSYTNGLWAIGGIGTTGRFLDTVEVFYVGGAP